jgi:site-specific recombinase XerD
LRSFAAFLTQTAPEVTSTAQVTRRHIEDYKPWLAARPGQNKPQVTTATIAHRLGTLRMFFVRLDEWAWAEAPPRVPMFPGDLPRQDHPLPKALDDATAARLLRAAQNDKRLLVRVTVEMLLRTGLRVASTPRCAPMRSCTSAPARGCTSRSASSARTATCRCTRTWSP